MSTRDKKIRNPIAHGKKHSKQQAIEAAKREATVRRIIELVITEPYWGADTQDVARQLRSSGALGERDRVKRYGDLHTKRVEEALDAALASGAIRRKRTQSGGVRIYCPKPPAVHPRVVRRYESATYPPMLMVIDDHDGWQPAPNAMRHLRGAAAQLLLDAA